ncbi:MAG: pyridoxal 5'-phosphate synthase glutaminase subunit PdxT [Acidimicrobiaceae bacterium]|jgi:5'-phosphate synthase pdxT subunit|nr:pyridoxal 5'-phosphate synthase glutaminase subunit PdxT [Acidimicrobiaceae bacterium]MDP7542489.1 pyridoxal 5'-phosphate synthase glutaminase subunit PdxT [Acidimicrobiales bacterium]|tara:strand:- start:2175 stop:2759 length:585 start_codon:yes stop_codon:yes gene_type:complete
MKVGVLALQGAFASHAAMLGEAGATPVEVRRAHELAEVDALVMPGGESTTMSMLLDIAELSEPLAGRLADGMPVFGTCAGMILLAVEVLDGRSDQRSMGAIDLDVRRNGYGRQVDSFETELAVEGFDDTFHGVFIRSPVVERIGPDVEVLAEVEGRPVLCRQGNVLVASFHPELAGDVRIHRRFLEAAFASDAT